LVRGIVPLSFLDDAVMLFGSYTPTEDRLSHTTVVDVAAAGAPSNNAESQISQASQVSQVSRPATPSPKNRLTLTCVAGSLKDQKLEYREPMILGRDTKRANTLIPAEDKQASGLHASIRQSNGKYMLKDEHSSNGTRLNGTRIDANGDPVALREGDTIEIGIEKFIVTIQ